MTAFLLLHILQSSASTSAILAGSMMMSVCWFTSEMFSHKCTLWWHSLLLKLLQINISLIKILNELACFNYVFCATRLGTHRAAPYSRTAPRVVKLLHTAHRQVWFGRGWAPHRSSRPGLGTTGAYYWAPLSKPHGAPKPFTVIQFEMNIFFPEQRHSP